MYLKRYGIIWLWDKDDICQIMMIEKLILTP